MLGYSCSVSWRCFGRLALYVNRSSALIIHARKKPFRAWCLCPLVLSNWYENAKRWKDWWVREIQRMQEDHHARRKCARAWAEFPSVCLLPRHCNKIQQPSHHRPGCPKIQRRLLTFSSRADHDDLLLQPWVRMPRSGQLWEEECLSCGGQPQAEPAVHLHPQAIASPADDDPRWLHSPHLLQFLHPAFKYRKNQDQVSQFAWQCEEKPHKEHSQSERAGGQVFSLALCVIW